MPGRPSSAGGSGELLHGGQKARLAFRIRSARRELAALAGLDETALGRNRWKELFGDIRESLKNLADEEARKRAEALQDELLDAEAEIIEGNIRLVRMVVRRYASGFSGALEEMDLVQEGCEGLLDAVRRFDFAGSRGFMTYALIRIKKRVLLAVERQQRLVRLPAHAVRKSVYIKEIMDDFAGREGRHPLPHELEDEIGDPVDWSLILSLSEKVVPITEPAGESGIPLSEKIPGAMPSPEESIWEETLQDALEGLDRRSRFVLVMRYGLLGGESQTLESISRVLGVSIERTRQIEKKALDHLRVHLRGFSITDWLRG